MHIFSLIFLAFQLCIIIIIVITTTTTTKRLLLEVVSNFVVVVCAQCYANDLHCPAIMKQYQVMAPCITPLALSFPNLYCSANKGLSTRVLDPRCAVVQLLAFISSKFHCLLYESSRQVKRVRLIENGPPRSHAQQCHQVDARFLS